MAKHTPGPWKISHRGGEFEAWLVFRFNTDSDGDDRRTYIGEVHSLDDARLIAAAPTMLEALDNMVMICGRTGNALDDFEEQAERFRRETGFMRPGKDMAAASGGESDHDKRRARYNEWIEEKIANARAAIAKAGG